jgi:2-oxoglutarate dehydrogenase E1 component
MYKIIKDRPPVHRLYAERLMAAGVAREVVASMAAGVNQCLEDSFGKEDEPVDLGFHGEWSGIQREYVPGKVETGVPPETLRDLAEMLACLPEGFQPHPKIQALLAKRLESVKLGTAIDWGTGEALAFATLLRDGTQVRLSGQDSRRGTFSHRHAFVYDQETGAAFAPLAQAGGEQRMFRVYDSMLSENAVLAFEYGYSLAVPAGLTIWEAQFGDFANGAQVIIDQFIVAGETKWDRVSGLVMLLPHGFEGQGAEHSSARIERYLQLCADDNLQVVYPSTPAQFFHLLRRQVKQPFRIPLIVFTPKSLFRHPLCISPLDEFTGGWFREILPDSARPEDVRRVLICSGKIYFDLLEGKTAGGLTDTLLVRIEQLYPLRNDLLREALSPYQQVQSIAWVQEEPRNMGGWSFIQPQLTEILGREPHYIGRPAAAAPAVGSHRQHKLEQEKIIMEALQF